MKSLILILLFSAFTNAFAISEDVAIDPKTGDTIIVQKTENPLGTIIFLNDLDEKFRQEIKLLPIESDSARFEIELIKSNEVIALITIDNQFILKKIIKQNGVWKLLSTPEFFGDTLAGNLATLENGDFTYNTFSNNEEMIAIADSMTFKVKELVPANLVRLRALSIAPNLEVSGDVNPEETTFGEDDGDDEIDLRRSGMGFAAGAITGLGISYRRHLANKWGYQFTGIPWASSSNYFLSIGANFMRTLHATERTRFMAIGGVSGYLRGNYGIDWEQCDYTRPVEPTEEYVDPCAGVPETWTRNNTINVGVGIGMEFSLGANIGLAIELPVVLMFGSDFGIYPIPSVSLIYYF